MVENIYLGMSGVVRPNAISAGRVAIFLSSQYFPAAIQDPIVAMNRWGTADFRALHLTRGLDSYRRWYAPVREIPPNFVTVGSKGDSPDTFTVDVERILKDGRHDSYEIIMTFTCSNWWQAHLPMTTCSSENLRLDSTTVTVRP